MKISATYSDFNEEFRIEEYQKTNLYQFLIHKNSCWSLMLKYYIAKHNYYNGLSDLTDQEFDSLEVSIKSIAGEEFLKKYGCVGYSVNGHNLAKRLLQHFESELVRRFTEPWNAFAERCKSLTVEVVSGHVFDNENDINKHTTKVVSDYVAEKLIIPKKKEIIYKETDLGQLLMF